MVAFVGVLTAFIMMETGGVWIKKDHYFLSSGLWGIGYICLLYYPNLLICSARLDFKFAALFLWIMLVFVSLSNIA